jgi:hypothetical protein
MRTGVQEAPVVSTDALLAAYAEICKSYHAIDDFRMKLLGLLPFTSLAGILLLSKDTVLYQPSQPGMNSRLRGHFCVGVHVDAFCV